MTETIKNSFYKKNHLFPLCFNLVVITGVFHLKRPRMKTYKCRHIGLHKGKHMQCNTDLIFIHDEPHLVLQWLNTHEREAQPAVVVKLDSSQLKTLDWPDAQFVYEGRPIEVPDIIG